MKYMGSKARIANDILSIVLKDRTPDQYYFEPFVGGANIIDKVDGRRVGSDINSHVISALILIRDNIDMLPINNKEFTERDYKLVKKDPSHYLYGYVGFALSYAGKFYGGWCRDRENKRDYVKEAFNNARKQSPKLQGLSLKVGAYDEINLISKNCIIYCDPPYQNTTKYSTNNFDHPKFFE